MTVIFFPGRSRWAAPRRSAFNMAKQPGTRRPWRAWLRAYWLRWRTRTLLSQLDSYMLKDIGLTRHDVDREANKPFWSR